MGRGDPENQNANLSNFFLIKTRSFFSFDENRKAMNPINQKNTIDPTPKSKNNQDTKETNRQSSYQNPLLSIFKLTSS